MKLAEYLPAYIQWAEAELRKFGLTRKEILTGADAWHVAHKSGIYRHALMTDNRVVDAHVQTVLEQIFPHAKFLDKKVY